MKLKNDRYRRDRGGRSQVLILTCESCGNFLCYYQKDGPGILKRLYIDRISDPKKKIRSASKLVCSKCRQLIGLPITYKKEDRAAIRLFAGAVSKQKTRLTHGKGN